MRHVELDMRWPLFLPDPFAPQNGLLGRSANFSTQDENWARVCTLVGEPAQLTDYSRSTFLTEIDGLSFDTALPHQSVAYRVLLKPLKLVQRAIPGLVVEMPEPCPLLTAELAEEQQE